MGKRASLPTKMRQAVIYKLATHPYVLWLFTQIWIHRLEDRDPDRPGKRSRVIRIKGWRTALIETSWGQRCTVEWL